MPSLVTRGGGALVFAPITGPVFPDGVTSCMVMLLSTPRALGFAAFGFRISGFWRFAMWLCWLTISPVLVYINLLVFFGMRLGFS